MSGPELWTRLQHRVAVQTNYLRGVLPPAAGICAVCRGPAAAGFTRCYQCHQQHQLAHGRTADAVVPIAYAVKSSQHAHNLWAYKSSPPVARAAADLSALLVVFLRDHGACLARIAGGALTLWGSVPSTRGRPGPHPVEGLVRGAVLLPRLEAEADVRYRAEDREFHRDRFVVRTGDAALDGQRILVLDDTWTTGARTQSLACALKEQGAASVVTLVLGRHLNPSYGPAGPILDAIRDSRFDPDRCAADDL